MSADYLASSLPALSFNEPPPLKEDAFLAMCRDQLSAKDAAAIEAIMTGAPSSHPLAVKWRDLETQMKNVVASERSRASGVDASKWQRPADGCSLFWRNRISAAFAEKDVFKRDAAIDAVFYSAADELADPASPLSAEAVFAYAVRLKTVLRRSAIDAARGMEAFAKSTDSSRFQNRSEKE